MRNKLHGPETGFEDITLRAILNNKDHISPERTSWAFASGKRISRQYPKGVPVDLSGHRGPGGQGAVVLRCVASIGRES